MLSLSVPDWIIADFSDQSMDTITPVVQYIESQMQRMNVNALNDGDMLNMLGGEGGVQIDVVFYLVSNSKRSRLETKGPKTNTSARTSSC